MSSEPPFWVPFIGVFCWLGFWIGASVLFRRHVGKPIIPCAPTDARFTETRCSGRSLANLITKIGGARNCLLVYVTDGELVVTPTFPFTLMFLPEIYGLELRAPLNEIEARVTAGLFGKVVRVDSREGSRPSIELRLRDLDEFVGALKADPLDAHDTGAQITRRPTRRYGFQRLFMIAFLILWGGGGVSAGAFGLRADFDFIAHGVVTQGVIIGDNSVHHAIVRYVVDGSNYTLDSLLGSGTYKIGGTEVVRYMPGRPEVSREQAYVPFDIFWVVAGFVALAIASTVGLWPWIGARRRNSRLTQTPLSTLKT